MARFTKSIHRQHVAANIADKVQEMHFFLKMVCSASEESLARFRSGRETPAQLHMEVKYGCSAFCNALQALKDAFETATKSKMTWSELQTNCRHGEFFYKIRNASTHDGSAVSNAWVDGLHYALIGIERFGEYDKKIEIAPLPQDIATCCTEFSSDFYKYYENRLTPYVGLSDLAASLPYTEKNIARALESDKIPDFVREIFDQHRDEIAKNIKHNKFDPIKAAIEKINTVKIDL